MPPAYTRLALQIAFEITGGGTASEEEAEDREDPQWARYRRQKLAAAAAAAAAKGRGLGSGGAVGVDGKKRRGAWTAAAQR